MGAFAVMRAAWGCGSVRSHGCISLSLAMASICWGCGVEWANITMSQHPPSVAASLLSLRAVSSKERGKRIFPYQTKLSLIFHRVYLDSQLAGNLYGTKEAGFLKSATTPSGVKRSSGLLSLVSAHQMALLSTFQTWLQSQGMHSLLTGRYKVVRGHIYKSMHALVTYRQVHLIAHLLLACIRYKYV